MFAKAPLPSWSVYVFGVALPFVETLLGLLLLLGLKTRWALVSGCGLLFVLTFGSSLRQDWEITALQLIYTATALLAGIRWNWFFIDVMLQRQSDDCAPCSLSFFLPWITTTAVSLAESLRKSLSVSFSRLARPTSEFARLKLQKT
jgi:hypothetical protein